MQPIPAPHTIECTCELLRLTSKEVSRVNRKEMSIGDIRLQLAQTSVVLQRDVNLMRGSTLTPHSVPFPKEGWLR
jgi:hypothetical protein